MSKQQKVVEQAIERILKQDDSKSDNNFECTFAVDYQGCAWLVDAPEPYIDLLDGAALEDNSFDGVPKEPGFYCATVEFEFVQGYYEGYPAPGESDQYFHVRKWERVK